VERIFYYVLFESDPGGFRLIDVARDAAGTANARVESPAVVEHLRARIVTAAAGAPLAAYEELIPDITAYFPTPSDLDRIIEASPFLP
jgi:hypothetical protein